MSVEDDMFQDWETPPEDLDFEVVQMNNEIFDQMLEMTASFSPDEARKISQTYCERDQL